MDNTAGFWLVLDLRAVNILDHLLEIGVQGQPDKLALYGRLDNTTDMQKNLQRLTLCANLPTIRLFGIFSFERLSFRLSIASEESKSFQLAGDIRVNIFDENYLFHGMLDADSQHVSACITSTHSLTALFSGQMPGIAFGDLTFMLAHAFEDAKSLPISSNKETILSPCKPGETLIWLTGKVIFAGLELTGELYLIENLPVFARLQLSHDLSISAFVKTVIPGCAWSSDIFDLQFMAGSQIYYREPQAALPSALNGESYQDGFNVLTHICLTVLTKLEFSLGIQVQKDGVKASVVMQSPLDLFIIQLTGSRGRDGPSFALDSTKGQNKLQFVGGVRFFEIDCGNIAISCANNTTGDLRVEGVISVANSVFRSLIPQGSSLKFSYDSGSGSDSGFSLTGWSEFDFAHDCIDFISEIKKWVHTGRSDVCSEIGSFIHEKLLKTNFSLSPSFASEKEHDSADDRGRLYMCLDGQYTLSMFNTAILTLDFPAAVKFQIPEQLSWKALPDAIGKALAGAVPSLFEGIANNSENLTKLLFALSGEKSAEIAGTLICRNLIDKAIANALRAAATALMTTYAGDGAAAVGGGVLAFISSQFLDHPSPKPKPDPDRSSPPDRPENLMAQAESDAFGRTGILFSWSPAALAEKYQASLHDDQNTCLSQQETKDNVCMAFFPVNSDSLVPWYMLTVSAYGNGKRGESSTCKFVFERTLDAVVLRSFAEGLDGAACGKRVGSLLSQADPADLARSMARVGYSAQETLAGLATARPGLSLTEMTAALVAAYGAR
ncbi:MAG: hypothetical protein PHN64_08480 [Desulfovibrionaceae bacterium]|nr:hypothetical protein [Desulfovibrionaceae bacterium]